MSQAEADPTPKPSRRRFLTTLATAPVAAIGTHASLVALGADWKLVDLHRRWLEANKAYDEAVTFCEDHPALPALGVILADIEESIMETPAVTIDGAVAKSRIVMACDSLTFSADMARSVCADVLAIGTA